MPFKKKQKESAGASKKAKYKVTNWPQYNAALKKRGALSLYFPSGDLQAQFINEQTYCEGISGRSEYYTQCYVQLMYMIYRLLNFGIRQTTGYFEDLWESKGLDISVPSFGHLSDLFSRLDLQVKHYCDKVALRLAKGEQVSIIADSTGMSFSKASLWHEAKYGIKPKQRPWRKLHIGIDPGMETYSVEITDNTIDDRAMLDSLLSLDIKQIDKVIADRGYYSIEIVQKLYDLGISPVIPPPKDAVIHNKDSTKWHDQIVAYIKNKGSIYAFYTKYGYNIRSKVEAQMSRIKRCIGPSLKTQKLSSQKREGIMIANILNFWNALGNPLSVKVG